MSKPAPRIRIKGAYVIKSAESRPREIKPSGSQNGRAPVVTVEDKALARAVLQHHRARLEGAGGSATVPDLWVALRPLGRIG